MSYERKRIHYSTDSASAYMRAMSYERRRIHVI